MAYSRQSDSCTRSPSIDSRSLLADEELEPYVRKQRSDSSSRKKLEGLNDEEQIVHRTNINSRERKRMHDLNDSYEELRSCLPYEQGSKSRKMSKINTLLLARNYINQQHNTIIRLEAENNALRALLMQQIPVGVGILTTSTTPAGCSKGKTIGQKCHCISCITSDKFGISK